jgi:dipeptidase E
MAERHIVAMGGGGFSDGDPLLDDFVLGLTGRERPRVCFVGTASGDSDSYTVRFYRAFRDRAEPSDLPLFATPRPDLRSILAGQDVIYVGGGNTANMLAVWRVHGLEELLREAWAAGTVLAGISAGAICWFEAGVTDSFGPLAPLEGCLGLLAGSFCPHYDGEADRRPAFQRLVADGLPSGFAADDGVALHFTGTELSEAVASRAGGRAFRVERGENGVVETPLAVRLLG